VNRYVVSFSAQWAQTYCDTDWRNVKKSIGW